MIGRKTGQILAYVLLALAVAYAFKIYGDQTEAARKETLRSCLRSNLNAATIRNPNRADDLFVNPMVFPILDCPASQKRERLVILSEAESEKFIRLVSEGYAPIVEKGRVTGVVSSLEEKFNRELQAREDQ